MNIDHHLPVPVSVPVPVLVPVPVFNHIRTVMRPIYGNKTDEFFLSLKEIIIIGITTNSKCVSISIEFQFLVMYVVFYNSYYKRKYCASKFDYR